MKIKFLITTALIGGIVYIIPTIISYGSATNIRPTVSSDQGKPAAAQQQTFPRDTSVHWEKMTKDQKIDYMKNTVLPKMKTAFAAFDANKYARVNCMTCHGDGAKDKSFKMPNPKIFQLPNDQAGFKKLGEKQPDYMKFMMGTVKPQMAALLNLPEHSEKNPKGFGCLNCHTTKQ